MTPEPNKSRPRQTKEMEIDAATILQMTLEYLNPRLKNDDERKYLEIAMLLYAERRIKEAAAE